VSIGYCALMFATASDSMKGGRRSTPRRPDSRCWPTAPLRSTPVGAKRMVLGLPLQAFRLLGPMGTARMR